MRIRLARTRLQETRNTDLAEAQPASLIVTIERLANTVEDLLKVIDEGCARNGSPAR